ncbi:MAG: hypothetical protein K0R49_1679 [Burkholderiales bacterium]|jgi:hypothetical protein|nr:hypothetical protein [Burkholderiales bacterium]
MELKTILSEEEYKTILHYASFAMSGDNCQPWRFKKESANTLLILHDENRAKHLLNPNNISSVIAFGTLVEAIYMGAQSIGYSANYKFMSDFGKKNTNTPWVEISFEKKINDNDFDADAFFTRSVIRNNYQKQAIPFDILNNFPINFSDIDTVKISLVNHINDDFIEFSTKVENKWWQNSTMIYDILKWVRWTNKKYIQVRDGMHWSETGCSIFEIPLIWLVFKSSTIRNLIKTQMSKNLAKQTQTRLTNSGGLIAFSTKDQTLQSFFDVGRVAMRSAIKLKELGIVYQPLSLQSFFINQNKINFDIPEIKLPLEELNAHKDIVRKQFNLENNFLPLWIFRIGYPIKKVTTKSSLRLDTPWVI